MKPFLLHAKKQLRRALERVKLHKEAFLDAERYYRSASWAGPVSCHYLAHLESEIIKHYHVLEKSLSMPEFRSRAGQDILKRLIQLVDLWNQKQGAKTSFHYLASLSVIRAYHKKHEAMEVDVSDLIPLSVLALPSRELPVGGGKTPNEISPAELALFDKIALSRHSVRNFDPKRIPEYELVTEAVRIATSTPSVCNRQTWRVHFYEGADAQRILAFQNGNRGFGHLIPLVAVVTSDMRLYAGNPERYQAWIEGGLFSMNFMLALHARGISSVALNWSRLNKDDSTFHRTAEIPTHERIAMLIGCGYAVAGHEVACSPRSPTADFITWHFQNNS
jgi:nitroreductase